MGRIWEFAICLRAVSVNTKIEEASFKDLY